MIPIIAPTAWAGIGMGISSPAVVDTKAPEISLDLPQFFFVYAEDQFTFNWTSSDDHPGSGPEDFTASVWIDQQLDQQISWYPDITEFSWTWTAPIIQTAHCYLEVSARDTMGNFTVERSNDFTILFTTTSAPDTPTAVSLQGPYPNPFNPSCEMDFSLPVSGSVDLGVYDARGRLIRNLIRGDMAAGTTHVRWDGTDQQGRSQPGGLYFLVLKTEGPDGPIKLVRKAVLIP